MPGKLFNIKRYFKRNGKTQIPPPGQPVSSVVPEEGDEVTKTTTTIASTTTQVAAPAPSSNPTEPYSGIGYPPGGGEPYSGAGYPPSSASSAPPKKTTKTTVTRTTATKPQPKPQVLPPKTPPADDRSPPVSPAQPEPSPGGEGKPSQSASSSKAPVEGQPPAPSPVSELAIDTTKRAGMDVLARLTQRSNKAILQAVQKAKDFSSQYIDTEHVLWGLLTDSGIYQLLSELKVTPKEIQSELTRSLKKGKFTGQPQFSPRVKKVLELALSAARSLGFEFISPEHILLALAQEGEGLAAQILAKFNVTVATLNQKIVGKKEEAEKKEAKGVSALEQYCHDLTQAAREGKLDPVVARANEIERAIHILSRRTKNNPCLIGDAGVGKTAIVEGLAQRIATGDVPEPMANKKVLQLDLMSLIAGARHRGEFEERLKTLVREIKAASGQTIIFIDEIQNLVGAGAGEGAMDASNILKPSLARGELQAIGATTVTEYRKYVEKDPALERRFQPVLVAEPTVDQAIEMLRALRDKYEAFHKVSISNEAIEAAVKLSARYVGDRFLPDKAVDLMDEAASAVRLPAISLPEEIKSLKDKKAKLEDERKEAEKIEDSVRLASIEKDLTEIEASLEEAVEAYEKKKSTTTNVVTPEFIAEIVSRWTHIPISKLTEKESEKLLTLEELIHKKIIDQEAAVAAVSEAVRRGRAGLKRAKRPIGSFIFMGPTGVGKTETAKVLAEILFGSEEMMVRLDMSEFMEKHEVAKLIGAPPGYVGYEEGGQLTEAVRLHPYSVILLDEIEKAHPDVFNILIQLLEDGRLTDNKGRTTSFKNTIVIATSNIGTGLIQREMLEGVGMIEKIPVLSTYTISPVGGEMITFQERFWLKSSPKKGERVTKKWTTGTLGEFFAAHEVTNIEPDKSEQRLPKNGFDAHLIRPSGEELIFLGGRYWQRTSQVSREWITGSLNKLFEDYVVKNAALDDPIDQLPTTRISTVAVSPEEREIITLDNRVWWRENLATKEWKVESLKDYFTGQQVLSFKQSEDEEKGMQSGGRKEEKVKKKKKEEKRQREEELKLVPTSDPDLLLPTERLDAHLFTPNGEEIVIFGSRFWRRQKHEDKNWVTGTLAEFFTKQTVTNADPTDLTQPLPVGQAVKKAREVKEREEEEGFVKMAEKLIEELRKFFRPELLNRFDEIIVFRPLTKKHMLEIVELQLKLTGELLEEQRIGFRATRAARDQLAILGYEPLYGARPLRRTIQQLIENSISSMIIKGEAKPSDLIEVDFDGNNFVFNLKKTPKPKLKGKAETSLFKCLDCGQQFEAVKEEPCPVCGSVRLKKVEEEKEPAAPKWKCQTCGKEWEAKEKQPCPACQSEDVEKVSKEEKAEEVVEVAPTPPPEDEAQKIVEEAVEEVTESKAPVSEESGTPADLPPHVKLATYYRESAETSLFKCLDCGQQFEAVKEEPCPVCGSVRLKKIEMEASAEGVSTEETPVEKNPVKEVSSSQPESTNLVSSSEVNKTPE
jgi:ATP-dependent Clp protease ATP-binding subunit ClpC